MKDESEDFRYIPPIQAPAHRQMAIDESILRCYDKGICEPTLRFFTFEPSSITVGYSQDIDEVIHTGRCEELGIPYVRRPTGGGTVFHDVKGEITYSIVTEKMEGEIEESFHELLKPIIEVMQDMGLDARFKPYNDILIGKKKVSGSAQKRGKKGLLQHGTLMYSTDLETLADILKLDQEKMKEKGASSFFDLVTTMERELGEDVDKKELMGRMKDHYGSHLGGLEEKELYKEEIEMAERLENKYKDESWTMNRRWNDDR